MSVPEIVFFMDSKFGRGATFRLDSGERCVLSIARPSVRVKSRQYWIFGATLYEEKVVYRAARTTIALAYLYKDYRLPDGFNDPSLRAFANAIMHCGSCAEVSTVLNEAIGRAEELAGGSLNTLRQEDFGSWMPKRDTFTSTQLNGGQY